MMCYSFINSSLDYPYIDHLFTTYQSFINSFASQMEHRLEMMPQALPKVLIREHSEGRCEIKWGATGTRLSGGCSKKAAVELRPDKRPGLLPGPGGSGRCRGPAERMKSLSQHSHSCG